MAIVVIVLMFLCCTTKADVSLEPEQTEKVDLFKQVVCNNQYDGLHQEVIQKSMCGEPKEVIVELKPKTSYYHVVPSAVWVKRCVGLCDYVTDGTTCVATKIREENVPVRLYDQRTEKESCSTYKVEVHESCKCCATSGVDCAASRRMTSRRVVPWRRMHNPRKCSYLCPNMEETRNCLKQRNLNLRRNRYNGSCKPRRRVTWQT